MKIVEIHVEDVAEVGVVEVYLMASTSFCSDQEPFHYHDAASRRVARREALKRGRELAAEHECKVSWNF